LTAARHEYTLGREAIARSDDAALRQAWGEAIAGARSAALARLPGAPWQELGLKRLEALGRGAEQRGDRDSALLAYGAIRTAVVAAGASGGDRWLRTAEDGLSRAAATGPGPLPPPGVQAPHRDGDAGGR
jgi:hypothetical protein